MLVGSEGVGVASHIRGTGAGLGFPLKHTASAPPPGV